MRDPDFIKRYAEEKPIEEDNFSEPIDPFIESCVVVNSLDFTKTLLLDHYAIHADFESVK